MSTQTDLLNLKLDSQNGTQQIQLKNHKTEVLGALVWNQRGSVGMVIMCTAQCAEEFHLGKWEIQNVPFSNLQMDPTKTYAGTLFQPSNFQKIQIRSQY